MIKDMTSMNKQRLTGYWDVLDSTYSLYCKSACAKEASKLLEEVVLVREQMLTDIITRTNSTNSDAEPLSLKSKSLQDYTVLLEDLEQKNKKLREELAKEKSRKVQVQKECKDALFSLNNFKLSVTESIMTQERVVKTCTMLEDLNQQLKKFCVIGKRISSSKYAYMTNLVIFCI